MRTVIRGAFAAIAMGAAATAAQAADLGAMKAPPPAPVIDTFHPFQVRLKVGGVIPLSNGETGIYDGGAINNAGVLGALGVGGYPFTSIMAGLAGGPGSRVPGATVDTSWSVIPMLDVAYYLNKNWAIEAICCVSPHHVQGTGVLAGSSLARTWVFPPSLLLQYHFTQFGAWQPYLGVGVNFTTFWGTRAGNNNWGLNMFEGSPLNSALLGAGVGSTPGFLASFYSARVSPSWGVVGQAGLDYMFNDHWGLNVDVKYIMMEPNGQANILAYTNHPVAMAAGVNPIFIPVTAAFKINPLVVSAGLTYRFGGGAPILAKF